MIGLIRKASQNDALDVLAWRNHQPTREMMFNSSIIEQDAHLKWFEKILVSEHQQLLVYEYRGEPIGVVQLNLLGHVVEWGFYLVPDSKKGMGTKLGVAALEYIFKLPKVTKVKGLVLAFNQASLGLHLKLGFKQEGVLRNEHFDGERYIDVVSFGLLKDERT